jgi:phosphate-selective porin
LSEYADVSLGQFKIPISWEGYQSSSKLLFPERALSSRAFGDQRDIGLRVEKIGPIYYYAGLFNGTGLNRRDNNDKRCAASRRVPLNG